MVNQAGKKDPDCSTFFHAPQKKVHVNNFFFRQKNSHHRAVIGTNTTHIPYTTFGGKGEGISVFV